MGILRTDRVSGLGGANAIKGSVKFGNNHALAIHPNSADYRLGSNDFTIEFWGNAIGTGNAIIFGLFENSPARRSYTFETRSNRALRFECWSDGSSALKTLTSGTGVWELSTWHYFTVVRNGTALNIYVDGTSVVNTTFDNASDSIYANTVDPLIIGSSKQSNVYYGTHGALYISNFRLTNGTALYTGNFTPPNRELTKLSTTNVLCCQSSGDVLKEETGKTIVAVTNDTNSAPPQASKFTPNSPVGFSTTTDVGTQFGSTFDGVTTFDSQAYMVPTGGNTRERNRGRGIIGWGGNPVSPAIDFINIQSQGIATRWGTTITTNWGAHGCSSSTRGLLAGGYYNDPNTFFNNIEFLTIASEGKVSDFGDLSAQAYKVGALSNQTRGIFALGYAAPNFALTNVIDFVTIATAADASNFADITPSSGRAAMAACSSTTRGLFAGGQTPSSSDIIDFITIASQGTDATDFGNLTQARDNVAGASSNTRAVFGGGSSPTIRDTIDFVTIASAGDAIDFGNLVAARKSLAGTSDNTRGIFAGGYISPATTNVMNFVTIATTGDAADFGDLSTARRDIAAFSDSHGGLS